VTPKTIIALDVGEKRIGVAMGNSISRLPAPLMTLDNDKKALQSLLELVGKHNANAIVVGLPRGLNGQETAQTRVIHEFIILLKENTNLPIYSQDEALTSKKAEKELKDRGVRYNKGDVDALAATYILEDYFRDNLGLDV
jgi:putative Holliday junction resolvase